MHIKNIKNLPLRQALSHMKYTSHQTRRRLRKKKKKLQILNV